MSNFLTRALIESDSNYVIERSLRFMAASSQSLTRTMTSNGDRQKFTVSMLVKRGVLNSNQALFSCGSGVGGDIAIGFGSSLGGGGTGDTLVFGYAGVGNYASTAVFRDPSAYYHIVLAVDTTQGTAANRLIIYVNNTAYPLGGGIALNALFNINQNGSVVYFGRYAGTNYFDGYLSEVHFIDGQALTPSSFGEINPVTGQWVAKKYTGTYGTNGFYLDFKDGTSTTTLGNDKSGNGNNWTLTNFTRSAGVNDCWMLDVPAGNGSASAVQPSGNYATLNPLSSNIAVLEANLRVNNSGTDGFESRTIGSVATSNSKIYFEATITGSYRNAQVGIQDSSWTNVNANAPSFRGFNTNTGNKVSNTTGTSYGSSVSSGQVVGCAYDLITGKIWFSVQGVWQASGNPETGINPAFSDLIGEYTPCIKTYYLAANGTSTVQVNFGQRSFAYTPPNGFKALCTSNLPMPSIVKPSNHFNVQLSTGANIKTDSEALFTNELEWIKDRANANNHQLIDSVRGSNAVLQSNTTAAETTYTAPSGSSVGWVWRASDSGVVTNTNGSITSQVSANTTAGFSIATYTGTGVNSTVGHGLGISPSMVIVKRRDAAANWQVRHSSIAVANSIQLQLTNASASATTVWNSTSPTSSVFSLGTSTDVNASAGTYVAYCFAEIAGYSKFGSYTGNGSADGPFIHCGFRPAFIIIKCTSIGGTGYDWNINDTSRDRYNVASQFLQPNATQSEGSAPLYDILSNGFKLRNVYTSQNTGGATYIYMAFAETPFNYANAR